MFDHPFNVHMRDCHINTWWWWCNSILEGVLDIDDGEWVIMRTSKCNLDTNGSYIGCWWVWVIVVNFVFLWGTNNNMSNFEFKNTGYISCFYFRNQLGSKIRKLVGISPLLKGNVNTVMLWFFWNWFHAACFQL